MIEKQKTYLKYLNSLISMNTEKYNAKTKVPLQTKRQVMPKKLKNVNSNESRICQSN